MAETPMKVPTLEEMARTLGPADASALAVLDPPESQEAFRLMGAQIATDRILVDMNRILGTAFVFWMKATPTQQKKLKGFSKKLLAVAVDRAQALGEMRRTFVSASVADKSARVGFEASAGAAFDHGLALREQAETAFRTAIGTDLARRKQLTVAVGSAEDLEALASGLQRLSAFGVALLSDSSTKERADLAGIDTDYLSELEAEAAIVRKAAAGASGRLTANLTSQGTLDTLDGLCLDLLSHIIHAFSAARDRDGTIPRLVPLATRRLLASRNKRKATEDDGTGGDGGTPVG